MISQKWQRVFINTSARKEILDWPIEIKKDYRSLWMKKNEQKNYSVAKNSKEISEALGTQSPVDRALVEYKAQLSEMAAKGIENSGLTVNEIVKRSGIARSKVSAIKNGALAGISCDLFIKVIAATGTKIAFKIAS